MSPKLDESITFTSSQFNCTEVKPHFINPCCFGEGLAAWLREQLSKIPDLDFKLSETIQEDYGWGFRSMRGEDHFWVAMSCIGDGPQDPPAEWLIFVSYDPGFNIIKRLFHKPNTAAFNEIKARIRSVLESNPEISIQEDWRRDFR